MILGCSRECAALVSHGYCRLKAFLSPALKLGCAQLSELWFSKLLPGSQNAASFCRTVNQFAARNQISPQPVKREGFITGSRPNADSVAALVAVGKVDTEELARGRRSPGRSPGP